MNIWIVIKNILTLIAGLGVFMFGMKHMGDSLEASSADRLRKIFGKMTKSNIRGVTTGAAVTAIIQSSSATMVMVVGLVNAGVLTLLEAMPVIMGANIGTTVTGLIISLKTLPITEVFTALTTVGVFVLLFSKNIKLINIANIMVGLGFIFIGLMLMSISVKDFSNIASIKNVFANVNYPILLLLMGASITAIIQSSSATTGILITLAGARLMSIESAIYVILGINLGTCVTALLASIGTNIFAKRAAVAHLLFNLIGVYLFYILLLIKPFNAWIISILPGTIELKIAVFHIIFNVSTTFILLPFVKIFVKLVELITPSRQETANHYPSTKFIDDRYLITPSIALGQCKKEILYMAQLAFDNYNDSLDSLLSRNLDKKQQFEDKEKQIDYLNSEITKYLVKISAKYVPQNEESKIGTYYHVVNDIERIGDYAENIIEYTERLISNDIYFSDTAKKNIIEMDKSIIALYHSIISAFSREELQSLMQAEVYESSVDDYKSIFIDSHVKRLENGECSAESGIIFLSLISNMERIADHMLNVGKSIIVYANRKTSKAY